MRHGALVKADCPPSCCRDMLHAVRSSAGTQSLHHAQTHCFMSLVCQNGSHEPVPFVSTTTNRDKKKGQCRHGRAVQLYISDIPRRGSPAQKVSWRKPCSIVRRPVDFCACRLTDVSQHQTSCCMMQVAKSPQIETPISEADAALSHETRVIFGWARCYALPNAPQDQDAWTHIKAMFELRNDVPHGSTALPALEEADDLLPHVLLLHLFTSTAPWNAFLCTNKVHAKQMAGLEVRRSSKLSAACPANMPTGGFTHLK